MPVGSICTSGTAPSAAAFLTNAVWNDSYQPL